MLNAIRRVLIGTPFETLLAHVIGRYPRSFWSRVAPNHYQYPPGTWREVERQGIRYSLDVSDFVQWRMYYRLDDPVRSELLALVRPGAVVIDVGAHVGGTALPLALIVGRTGRVLCLEPFPSNRERLDHNARLNPDIRVEIIPKAAGDVPSFVAMASGKGNSAGACVVVDQPGGEGASVATLDEIVALRGLSTVDLIKIDTEGYEMKVLRGAADILSNLRPAIVLEITDSYLRRYGSSAGEVLTLLRDYGYRLRTAGENDELDAARPPARFQFDVVALPR